MTGAQQNIWGTPGGSLADLAAAYGAGVAAAGQRGERITADILGQAFGGDAGTHVFHDLHVPGHEFGANVDHIVLRGNRAIILDSKDWLPGFYWTVGGHTRRGLHRFRPADKHTVGFAVDNYRRLLLGRAKVGGFLVIHPSRPGVNHIWAMSVPDGVARATGRSLVAALEERLGPATTIDERLIGTLRGYLRVGASPSVPASWYPDPTQREQLRYWDGNNWTEWVSNNGCPVVDPI